MSSSSKIQCPKCGESSRIQLEHVIQGGKAYRAFECRACGYQWRTLETGEHVPDEGDRPDRSRSKPN